MDQEKVKKPRKVREKKVKEPKKPKKIKEDKPKMTIENCLVVLTFDWFLGGTTPQGVSKVGQVDFFHLLFLSSPFVVVSITTTNEVSQVTDVVGDGKGKDASLTNLVLFVGVSFVFEMDGVVESFFHTEEGLRSGRFFFGFRSKASKDSFVAFVFEGVVQLVQHLEAMPILLIGSVPVRHFIGHLNDGLENFLSDRAGHCIVVGFKSSAFFQSIFISNFFYDISVS